MPREVATPSPESKRLASRLSKYNYNPTATPSPSPLRSISNPLRAISTPVRQTPTPTTRKRVSLKRERSISDHEEDSYEDIPSLSEKAKTKAPGKKARPFAGPEVYAHLQPVTDHLKPDLDIIFCGINPGKKSASSGHHFAHPTNKFWRALHLSGLTPRLYSPSEDHTLPDSLNYGLTNLCGRPTAEQSELSTLEMKLQVPELTSKISPLRPRVVCFVGKKIWDIYEGVCEKTAGEFCLVSGGGGGIPQVKEEVVNDLESLPGEVKLERDTTPPTVDKEDEEVVEDEIADSARGAPIKMEKQMQEVTADEVKLSARGRKRTTKKVVVPIDWHKPRSLRLPFEDETGHTYFWVTPNTSGLERTPLAEQVEIFRSLRLFVEGLQAGRVTGSFRDIDEQGVITTAEEIRLKAIARSKST